MLAVCTLVCNSGVCWGVCMCMYFLWLGWLKPYFCIWHLFVCLFVIGFETTSPLFKCLKQSSQGQMMDELLGKGLVFLLQHLQFTYKFLSSCPQHTCVFMFSASIHEHWKCWWKVFRNILNTSEVYFLVLYCNDFCQYVCNCYLDWNIILP